MKTKHLQSSQYSITLASGPLPIVVRRRRGVRRMTIRYHPLAHTLGLTLPPKVAIAQGLHFVEQKRKWIEGQIEEKGAHIPFADGQTIPLFGKNYLLQHRQGRGTISIEGESIIVPGGAEFMARRVREWIKARVREEITKLAQGKAARIGQKIKKISLRDTISHWGSCSYAGSLSFSWRLAFAPYEVLDYIVAHEVAHLKEHNHSAAFWAVVKELCPNYSPLRQWLRTNGPTLYSYG